MKAFYITQGQWFRTTFLYDIFLTRITILNILAPFTVVLFSMGINYQVTQSVINNS